MTSFFIKVKVIKSLYIIEYVAFQNI